MLARDLSGRRAGDRREAAVACLTRFADERRVDDARLGVLGLRSGADLGVTLAAMRAERVAAAAASRGRGAGSRSPVEISSKINIMIQLGHTRGVVPPRLGILEGARCAAGVDGDVEACDREPYWPDLLDLFGRALAPPAGAGNAKGPRAVPALNP